MMWDTERNKIVTNLRKIISRNCTMQIEIAPTTVASIPQKVERKKKKKEEKFINHNNAIYTS